MAAQSCLLLVETSARSSPAAFVIAVPGDGSAQTVIESIRNTLLENVSKPKRFFKRYFLFQRPTVSVATLRPITVNSLAALPTCRALVQNAAPDQALTEAIDDPDSMDWAFYNHMFALYEDVFVDIDHQGGQIVLPRRALLVRDDMSSTAKRVFRGLASIVGGLVLLAIKLAENN
ncbi:metalloprotease 1 [Colletotrichum tofieldiae]|uniref:Metalloprotease 1 n=1 Tax=Colletotrichum tofieldiae TaxID=708197 RepID=A0A166RFI1_9PEZI|nr:metalloprotease 1 [Colletotrichum tofieldiae]GKT86137.1 metalloprotease 1 [Colletotrichum tofieldiae]